MARGLGHPPKAIRELVESSATFKDIMSEEATLTLYRHTKKPEWGTAVIAWERDGKRAYLFDSGMVKVLAEPFYTLMAPVTDSVESSELAARLTGHLERNGSLSQRTRTAPSVRFSLQQQLDWFVDEYPGGFTGEAWEKKARGSADMRRLKRHRGPAIADAQAKLNPEALEKLAANEQSTETLKLITDLLFETDLVATAQLDQLKNKAKKAPKELPKVLYSLLYSPNLEDMAPHFDDFVHVLTKTLGTSPSWELATSLLALVKPGVHVCVRRAAFARQAEWIKPDLNLTKQPTSLGYAGFLRLAHEVNDKLTELGHTPDDLFDVHDFIRFATTTAAQQKMLGEDLPVTDTDDSDTEAA